MTGVIVKSNETFEKALKRFTKSCEKSGILSDLRKNQYYEKPSEKRKRKLNQAKRKALKDRLIASGVLKPRPRPTRNGGPGGRNGGPGGGSGGSGGGGGRYGEGRM